MSNEPWEDCQNCGWNLAYPGLGEAMIGKTECTNCEHPRVLTEAERLEIGQDFDQRIHLIEKTIWPDPTLKSNTSVDAHPSPDEVAEWAGKIERHGLEYHWLQELPSDRIAIFRGGVLTKYLPLPKDDD